VKTRFNSFIFCSLLLSIAAPSARAAIFYWDGNNTTTAADGGAGTWDTITSNWNDAATSGASVTWPADGGIDNDASFRGTAGSVTVDAAGITVNDLTFGTTGYTISEGGLTLNGTLPAISVTGTATINSAITGTVAGGFVKTGTGTLVLGGANSFVASTTLAFGTGTTNVGAIRITNGSALSGITTITSANNNTGVSRLELIGGVTVTGTAVNTGGRSAQQTTGAILANISGNNEWGGPITITGTGGGYGIRSDAGTLTLSGGIRSNTASRVWEVGGAGDVLISGSMGGTQAATLGLTKFGAGTVTLSNANTHGAPTRINAGTLLITAATALQNSTVDMNAADAGALVVGPSLTTATIGGLSGSRNLSLLNTAATPAAIFLSLGSTANSTYTGVLSGVTNLYKVGTGTFTLDSGAAASLPLNALSANAGTLLLKSGAVTTSGIDPGLAAYAMGAGVRGGTLTVDGANLTLGGSRRFVVGAAANGTANLLNGSITAAQVVLGHNGTVTMNQSGGTVTTTSMYHQDGGSGVYNLTGGTLIAQSIYNNTANTGGTQTFTLNLNGGTLSAATGTTDLIRTNNNGTQISVLLGTGNTTIDTTNSNATIIRPMGDMSGQAGTFTKAGINALTLTGESTYTGGTTVSAGSLLVTNTTGSATGTGAVTVSGGLLGGTGTIGGNVLLGGGTRLDPGLTTGTLTVAGAVGGAGTVAFQLTDASSDKLVAGGIDPSALALDLQITETLTANAFVLVDSASAVTGTFASVTGIPSGYSLSYGYNDGVDSNNIALVKEGGSSPFQNWAGTTHGLSGVDAEPGADPDFDGLSNLVEFVIGGNPKASGDSLPTATVSGANLVFTFRRADLALTEPSISAVAETSANLTAWTPAVDGTNGVSILVTDDGFEAGVDKVEVSVPLSLSVDGKLFARLKVAIP
jgi:autotransporter-associated beta strand protein